MMMQRSFVSIYLTILSALWLTGWVGLFSGAPALAAAGLIVATSAPMIFFIHRHVLKQPRTEAHPVWVSTVSGLGAVMIMVTIYRFGDQHPIWMGGALACLIGWMVYLKWIKPESA